MQKHKISLLVCVAVVAAMLAVPTAAFALLTNEWGMTYAGTDTCMGCHASMGIGEAYQNTTHARFNTTSIEPTSGAEGMWPVTGTSGVGETVQFGDILFRLGAGTGLREYLIDNPNTTETGALFAVPNIEWDPALPGVWEIGGNAIEFENYTCGGCHNLGWTAANAKPNSASKFAADAPSATVYAWASDSAVPTTSLVAKYEPGASIQCEACHGTADATRGHMATGVGIITNAELLDSGICGQCHGRANGGNTLGFSVDQNLLNFIVAWEKTDVPTAENWNDGINAATGKAWAFYPNGSNRNQKHSYYNEWAKSGHAYRGLYVNDRENERVTPYMADGAGHYNAITSGGTMFCAKCHTGEGYAVRKGLAVMNGYNLAAEGATGAMGQECASCHIPHGAGTDSGMSVREPDAATTLAGIEMTSICEDCHNWQLEMEGATAVPSITAKADLTTRGGFSHPTREVYNGKGAMLDVADMDKFMPGVKCEQCHMPATKSDFPAITGLARYDDQSWKRYSHAMHIMDPAEAETYGLAAWGDSCSPCHAGQSQADLSANIEAWQTEAADLAAEFVAVYADAFAANASAGDQALLNRAYTNYRSYIGEGSMGAHNPPYIQAGLQAAIRMASSVGGSFDVLAVSPIDATTSMLSGIVLNGDGTPAVGAQISIVIDGVTHVVTTGENGGFAIAFPKGATIGAITWLRSDVAVSGLVGTPSSTPVTPPAGKVARIAGADRYLTAIEASKAKFASANTVVVATGLLFPDALGGASLAGAVEGPLLLTRPAAVPGEVIAEIDRLNATTVYVLGGTAAVSDAAFKQLDNMAGVTAIRLGGANRYETAVKVANEAIVKLGTSYDGTAFLATGLNFPDALASSPIMAAEGKVLVLADASGNFTLPAKVTKVKVLGGTVAVPASVDAKLGTKMDGARLAGAQRYATAAMVADYGKSLGMTYDGVGIATGQVFADALTAGPALGSDNAVLLLTPQASLAAEARNALTANKAAITQVYLFGGPVALSANVFAQVSAALL